MYLYRTLGSFSEKLFFPSFFILFLFFLTVYVSYHCYIAVFESLFHTKFAIFSHLFYFPIPHLKYILEFWRFFMFSRRIKTLDYYIKTLDCYFPFISYIYSLYEIQRHGFVIYRQLVPLFFFLNYIPRWKKLIVFLTIQKLNWNVQAWINCRNDYLLVSPHTEININLLRGRAMFFFSEVQNCIGS